jgi:colicin import membrane protein
MEDQNKYDKYRGLSAEEARRRIAEDERRALYEDPRYKAVIRQGERERAARQAEAEKRRRQQEEQREAEAQARLAAEKERQRRIWRASGNPDSTFEANWPELERRYLMQQMQAQEERWESIF